jgi:predicted GIY-YIG superfamily endonuclease
LHSQIDGGYYEGATQNVEKRPLEHNTAQSKFTSTKMLWNLVHVVAFETKHELLIEERRVIK